MTETADKLPTLSQVKRLVDEKIGSGGGTRYDVLEKLWEGTASASNDMMHIYATVPISIMTIMDYKLLYVLAYFSDDSETIRYVYQYSVLTTPKYSCLIVGGEANRVDLGASSQSFWLNDKTHQVRAVYGVR